MKIMAAVARAKAAPFVIEALDLGEPRDTEVLVKIVGVGLCHTDLIVRDQSYPVPLPAVLGHEGSGIVERVGARVRKVKPGDHVVLTFNSCGQCKNCLAGRPAQCLDLYDRNFSGRRPDRSSPLSGHDHEPCSWFFGQSAFATYAIARERNVVAVPKDVPLNILGPLGCGVQTGAGGVMNSLRPEAGSTIAVFGAGSVGLSAVMAARVVGCTRIIAIDIKAARLSLARQLGATDVIDGRREDAVRKITEITDGGADYALETTALPEIFRQAVDCLAPTGTCGLIGAAPLGTEVTFDMNAIMFGRTIKGIIEGDSVPDIFIPRLVELYRQGRFPFDRLIEFYALDEINKAVADAEAGVVLKPVLLPPQ